MKNFFPRLARWLSGRGRYALNRLQALRVEPRAWLADRASRSRFTTLDETQLRALVRSDTCFIFGSGRSLDDIGPSEWEAISKYTTIGFNYFSRARLVPVDFHVVAEMASHDIFKPESWEPTVQHYARLIEENPFYADTVLGLQEGLRALQANRLTSSGMLSAGRRIFRFRRVARGELRPPTTALCEGLVHGAGTLVDCINLALILGARDIVLAGVDLYDSRVFTSGETASPQTIAADPQHADKPHLTADAMVAYLNQWSPLLRAKGVTLSVYNPRSLLARVLPVRARVG